MMSNLDETIVIYVCYSLTELNVLEMRSKGTVFDVYTL